jgi:hypothetical protein
LGSINRGPSRDVATGKWWCAPPPDTEYRSNLSKARQCIDKIDAQIVPSAHSHELPVKHKLFPLTGHLAFRTLERTRFGGFSAASQAVDTLASQRNGLPVQPRAGSVDACAALPGAIVRGRRDLSSERWASTAAPRGPLTARGPLVPLSARCPRGREFLSAAPLSVYR